MFTYRFSLPTKISRVNTEEEEERMGGGGRITSSPLYVSSLVGVSFFLSESSSLERKSG